MREDQALRPDMPELRNAAADRACVKITRGLIEEYINGLRRKQHPFDSRKTYRRALQLFCDSLPESMEVDGSTLLRWRKELLEKGYAARTINVSVSVVNSFLNWLGHREFQLTDRLEPKGKQSNLTASPLTKGLPSSPYSMSHVTSVLSSEYHDVTTSPSSVR